MKYLNRTSAKWAALYAGSMSDWKSDIQLLAENDPHS